MAAAGLKREWLAGILPTLPGAQERRWFGRDGDSVAGKMVATCWEGEIVLRLPAA